VGVVGASRRLRAAVHGADRPRAGQPPLSLRGRSPRVRPRPFEAEARPPRRRV